jgi:hypothetical protein
LDPCLYSPKPGVSFLAAGGSGTGAKEKHPGLAVFCGQAYIGTLTIKLYVRLPAFRKIMATPDKTAPTQVDIIKSGEQASLKEIKP